MKSLPRLAFGVFFAAILAVSTHATTVSLTTSGVNTFGTLSQNWNIAVPSTVNIGTSITINVYAYGGAGGSSISRNGTTYVTGVYVSVPGGGSQSASNSAYNQPAGNYAISQGFGGRENCVYGTANTTLTW